MLLLEALEIGGRHLVVGIALALLDDVDDDGRTDQAVNRYLVHGRMSLREVDGCIQVRAAVLGGEEAVGRIVVAGRRHAVGVPAELKSLGGGPIDRLRIVGVREIDDLALRKRHTRRRARAGTHDDETQQHDDGFHGATVADSGAEPLRGSALHPVEGASTTADHLSYRLAVAGRRRTCATSLLQAEEMRAAPVDAPAVVGID